MNKSFAAILGLFLLAGGSLNVQAGVFQPSQTFTWTGTCIDCLSGNGNPAGSGQDNGTASPATAVVTFSGAGEINPGVWQISSGDEIVAFSYNSILLSLTADSVTEAYGWVGDGLGVDSLNLSFYVAGMPWVFNSDVGGMFDVGKPLLLADVGGGGTFSASAVPEPATLALLGLSLAGIGFSRRKAK